MQERPVNFAYVVIDCLLDKVKNFNLPTFSYLNRETMEHMPYASHLTLIFKHFEVKFGRYEVQRVEDSKKIRASTLKSMKLFRTVRRGYVYQPYLREEDVMVDPKEQKFMPHKRDMIFIRKKGNQPPQSSAVPGEEEEENLGEKKKILNPEVNIREKLAQTESDRVKTLLLTLHQLTMVMKKGRMWTFL